MLDLSQVTDILLGNTPVEQVSDSRGNVLWSAAPVVLPNYFYVEDISGSNNTLSIVKSNANAPTIEVFKSTDRTNWSSMGTTDTTAITATVPANSKLYLKAVADRWGTGDSYYNTISMVSYFNVGGNTMSLLYGDNFENQTTFPTANNNIFPKLFKNTQVVSAADLELPATTLVDYCYYSMFIDCTTLTTAPVTLPATTLVNYCYQYMFQGCTALTTAPALPATTLTTYCYHQMFNGCTALTTAPELPATTLVLGCYHSMFNGCSSLNSVTSYAQDISATNCTSNWLNGVAAQGDFYNLGGATYTSGDPSGIPSGWTEHNSL